jgi:hypothetical protein
MKLLYAVLLLLLNCASLAATNNGALLVTVAVVRPAAVTTVVDANGRASRTSLGSREQPRTLTIANDGIRRVIIEY